MKKPWLALLLLIAAAPAFGQATGTYSGRHDYTNAVVIPTVVSAFPASPITNQVVLVTDDSASGACDSAAGSARTWCLWNGSAWVPTPAPVTGGRSLTTTGNTVDADAELYTVAYHFPFFASSVVSTNDITFAEIEATFTPTRWVCLAQGGSGLTTIDASIEECNSSGTSCAGIAAVSTVTAVDTPNADTSFTDSTLTAGNWLRFVFGTITWTTPGTFSCSLRGTRDD